MEEARTPAIMKRDAVGRMSYTEQQRETLLDEFERSGLKGAQFALAAGGKYQTFAHWVQQRRHARDDYRCKVGGSGLRLVEAVLETPAPNPSSSASRTEAALLEVVLPGGAKLLVASTAQVELAAQLIQALRTSC
jgi:hypothetical protein